MNIVNFQQVSKDIASSGQPSESDFSEIAGEGYQVVINLALSTSDNAISNEGDIVTQLGMSYVHIPVQWEEPKVEQFELFAAVMQQANDKKVWVHCALNMRVSAFLYLYSLIYLDEKDGAAIERMHKIWQPNKVWQSLIESVRRSCE